MKSWTDHEIKELGRHFAAAKAAAYKSVKTCNTCGYEHLAVPAGGSDTGHGYYFQCEGGCNSTMFIKKGR